MKIKYVTLAFAALIIFISMAWCCVATGAMVSQVFMCQHITGKRCRPAVITEAQNDWR